MTATYTNQPGIRDIDTVRHEIDDKDCDPESGAKLTDEEIQYAIDSNHHILLAAADCAEQIGATYARLGTSKMVGDLQINYGNRADTYRGLAKKLRSRAAKKAGSKLYAGGISHTDKDALKADDDRIKLTAAIGQTDSMYNSQTEEQGVMDY